MADGWKGFQKFIVVGNDRCHLGLLEHDFRNPDGIRVPGSSPGEVSRLFLEPPEKSGLDFSSLGDVRRIVGIYRRRDSCFNSPPINGGATDSFKTEDGNGAKKDEG